MSQLIFSEGRVHISTYAGPYSQDSEPRKRVQISTAEQIIVLDIDQWRSLHKAARRLGPECEGREL